jgi:hypothetical protein
MGRDYLGDLDIDGRLYIKVVNKEIGFDSIGSGLMTK